jgi:hypothetical protein
LLKAQSAARLGNILVVTQLLDLGGVRLHVRQGLPAALADRLNDDPDRAVGITLHDFGGATDELVNRFAKRTEVALERLRDQRLRKRLKLGVEHILEPTPTLLALRAESGLPRQAATPALLVGELMGEDATTDEVCTWCVLRCGLNERILWRPHVHRGNGRRRLRKNLADAG